MTLWTTLTPLILGSAIVPIQIVITILLIKTPRGVLTSAAFVAGMTTVKLTQGALFGFVFTASAAEDASATDSESSAVVAVLLLVVAVLFLVTAFKQLFARVDPDAPPPKWMGTIASMTPDRAYLLGLGLMVIGAKFWVFTLGAVGAIADERLGAAASVAVFVVFIVASEIVHLVVLAIAVVAPKRSASLLDAATGWLQHNNRVIMILIGFVFGAWFAVKALQGLGVF
ncbi:GAP family protein [Agromyces italicus]|uniref:GAP family protein n=1 Tax=Agromyces italicus TaxID=279572 RepID=UPI0003B3847A|nr:GAP family protein [Agromyces italicus]